LITYGSGNLLTADAEALVNTVNTVGVMGKGIALQFKRAYPANYAAYRAACAAGQVRIGHMFVYDTQRVGPRRYLINFPTKEHWRSRSRLRDIEAGLRDLATVVRERNITSIAIPALGCGNGGLDWGKVRPLIERTFAELPGVRVLLYPPSGAPDPADMPVGGIAPPMTSGRAVLLTAIDRYLTRAAATEPREGVTELEIQKIAYFLEVLGQPLRLAFARGRYGPYAEALHHVLQAMEGHYLVGYGDRTSKVVEMRPIRLTPDASAVASAWLEANEPAAHARIEGLMRLVDGYETPYSVELLATVHFAAKQMPPATEITQLVDRVRAWSGRKARLFTADHISMAVERLHAEALIEPMSTPSGQP
jgi:O-acetyl-ADP-ribose deacetylase (regulator of RNase III)